MTIALLPLGPVDSGLVAWLSRALADKVDQKVVPLNAVSLPQQSYNRRRRQYRGEDLLRYLERIESPGADRILGLVEADCYASGLNFIFGQAMMGGRNAFVALPRLRPSFYNAPEDAESFRERVLKETVHELGHTWGLSHCPDPKCVMHFSNTLHDTDVKDASFCERCASAPPAA